MQLFCLTFDLVCCVQVLERVKLKAATYGQDPGASAQSNGAAPVTQEGRKILPERVRELYEGWIMPLTKQVEVQYLLRRLS